MKHLELYALGTLVIGAGLLLLLAALLPALVTWLKRVYQWRKVRPYSGKCLPYRQNVRVRP